MKKLIGTIVLVFAITVHVNAQEGMMRKKMNHPNFTPEQQATLHTKRMTLALDLTTSQQREIQKINLKTAADRKVMSANSKSTRGSQAQLTDTQKYEKAIARLDKRIAHKAQLKTILSKDQYEKWSTFQGQKMRKHGKKHGRKGSNRMKGMHKMNR